MKIHLMSSTQTTAQSFSIFGIEEQSIVHRQKKLNAAIISTQCTTFGMSSATKYSCNMFASTVSLSAKQSGSIVNAEILCELMSFFS